MRRRQARRAAVQASWILPLMLTYSISTLSVHVVGYLSGKARGPGCGDRATLYKFTPRVALLIVRLLFLYSTPSSSLPVQSEAQRCHSGVHAHFDRVVTYRL